MDIQNTIAQINEGNTEAFADIFNEYADQLYRFIRIKVPDRFQAEELVQETFIKAWHGLPRLNPENLNFRAWLYTIAANTTNDFYRKQYRSPQTLELDDQAVSAPEGVESNYRRQEDLAVVTQALTRLPTVYRQVLELRFTQGLTLQETAHILNRSNLAVRLLQHRALRQLRQSLNVYDQS